MTRLLLLLLVACGGAEAPADDRHAAHPFTLEPQPVLDPECVKRGYPPHAVYASDGIGGTFDPPGCHHYVADYWCCGPEGDAAADADPKDAASEAAIPACVPAGGGCLHERCCDGLVCDPTISDVCVAGADE